MKRIIRILKLIFIYSMIYLSIFAVKLIAWMALTHLPPGMLSLFSFEGKITLLALCVDTIFIILHLKKRKGLARIYVTKPLLESFGFAFLNIFFIFGLFDPYITLPWSGINVNSIILCAILFYLVFIPIIYFVFWIVKTFNMRKN